MARVWFATGILMVLGCLHFCEGKPIYKDDGELVERLLSLLKDIDTDETVQHRQRQTGIGCAIYYNGIIYTVDKAAQDWSEEYNNVLVVENGIINYVGKETCHWYEHDVRECGYDQHCSGSPRYIDLEGSTVLPGIHDVHNHLLEAMSSVGGTCKFESPIQPNSTVVKDILRECRYNQVGTEWILGHGHSIYDLIDHVEEGGGPPIEILDDVIKDAPVVIMEETSHSVWVNTEALKRYQEKIGDSPVTGGLVLDGAYKGILLENAGNDIMEMAMSPSAHPELLELNYKGLLDAFQVLKENGITSVCDARSYWKRKHHEAYLTAEGNDKLTARVILGLWAYPNVEDDEKQFRELKKLYRNDLDSLLRISQIKVYSDGITPTATAAVFEDYLHPLPVDGLGKKGINYFTEERLEQYIKALQYWKEDVNGKELHRGFDFHIHAIGDRGIHESLQAINKTKNFQDAERPSRHRLTHVELAAKNDIPAFVNLGVIADIQVAGNFTLPNHQKEIAEQVGWEKAERSFPVWSLWKTGAKVTLSSDWDVSPVNPFLGMWHAIDRGEESVDIKAAVEMYTINPAFVMRQEYKVGSLVAGKEADFIVIDRDIIQLGFSESKAKMKEIKDTQVLRTFLQGEEIYNIDQQYPARRRFARNARDCP